MRYRHVRQKVGVEKVFVADVFGGDHYESHVGMEFWNEAKVQVVADHFGQVAAETSNEIDDCGVFSLQDLAKLYWGVLSAVADVVDFFTIIQAF